MTTLKIIGSVLIYCMVFNTLLGQSFSPKMDTLRNRITRLTYSNQYDSAQAVVLAYLKKEDLSELEKFYGHFTFADIAKSSGNSEQAIKLLFTSMNILPDIPTRKNFESLVYGNISECYFNTSDYENAQRYALQSIKANPNSSFRSSGHAVNNIIIGYAAYKEKKYDIALDYYDYAIGLYIQHGEVCELPLCYIKIAVVQLEKGELFAAQKTLEKSVELSDSCDIDQYRMLSSMALFDYYKQNKQYQEAIEVLQNINIVKNRLYDESKIKSMRDLEMKYETELTQRENQILKENARVLEERSFFRMIIFIVVIIAFCIIIILISCTLKIHNRKNKVLSKHLYQIEAQNDERKTLLKEIHHRVKNNLQVITSLLSLQAAQINDTKISNLFQQSQYRINTMAMVHEMLYQSDDLSKIKLALYFEELATALIRSIKGRECEIELDLCIPPVYLGLDTAIPLGLLINEVLTNALNHGLKNRNDGKIYIHLEMLAAPNFCLKIGDNGIGCPEGLNFVNSKTLGLKLIHKLARQLSGKIEIDTTKEGCHYLLYFSEIV